MSDTSPAYIGVQTCGCVTAVLCPTPGDEKDTAAFVADIIKRGMRVENTTVAEAKARPHFLVSECPHDPKGWEREPEPDPNAYKIRKRRTYRQDTKRVELVHRYHRAWPCGEVAKRDGKWWATPGWMDEHTATGTDGSNPRGPAEVFGPFKNQQQAAEVIAAPAFARLLAETQRRHDEREANPPQRSGPVPTHTASGKPVPPFKPGEVWASWAGEYLILDEPEFDTTWDRSGKQVCVRAKDLTHPPDTDNLLRSSWTYLTESCFSGMKLKAAASEARQ